MKRTLTLLVLSMLALPLSGCFGPPDAPDHAETDRDDDLPGLKLSTWTDEHGGRWRLHALVVNDSDQTYNHRVGCGEPWNVTLTGPSGQVEFRQVPEEPGCASQWEVLRPRGHLDTLYSWDFRDHDVHNGTSDPVKPGRYTWRIEFHLRDTQGFLATEHLRDVSAAESGWAEGPAQPPAGSPRPDDVEAEGPDGTELEGFWMDLQVFNASGQYTVRATVGNDGEGSPAFWTGCLTEWAWQILDASGEPVQTRPYGTCAGFSETTFEPGRREQFSWTWDGTIYHHEDDSTTPAPAGTYTWHITFGLRGTGEDPSRTFSGTHDFQV